MRRSPPMCWCCKAAARSAPITSAPIRRSPSMGCRRIGSAGRLDRRHQRRGDRRQSAGAAAGAARSAVGGDLLAGAIRAHRRRGAACALQHREQRRSAHLRPAEFLPAQAGQLPVPRRPAWRRRASTTPRRCARRCCALPPSISQGEDHAPQPRRHRHRHRRAALLRQLAGRDRPRARHGERRAAAGLPAGADRRPRLLGWRLRLQHAAGGGGADSRPRAIPSCSWSTSGAPPASRRGR